MPLLPDDFVPARGLANAHAQTVFGTLARRRLPHRVRRVRLDTPDGDFIDVDVLDGVPGRPVVLLLHGLEGSSASGYVRVMMRGLLTRGWTGVALNFRSCSGEPNRLAASYSSGDCRDALWLARRLRSEGVELLDGVRRAWPDERRGELGGQPDHADQRARRPGERAPHLAAPRAPRLYAVGFSLGGSVLLNLLSEHADTGLWAAAAVSAPYDLDACAHGIDAGRGVARAYLQNFLPTMKAKAREKARRFPHLLDADRIEAARTIRAFDEAVTAPLFGFASAEDYYARCSTAPKLGRITVPTLLVSAQDDPLAPARHLPGDAHRPAALHLLVTRTGGHIGFVARSVLRPTFWSEAAVLDWLGGRA